VRNSGEVHLSAVSRSYRLDVTAPERADAALSCGMDTDSGWNVGQSMESTHCGYTYPDDANK
jgi:hypothetical protein